MNNTLPVTGIILAGGKSSRMGTDKALLVYKGRTLIENAIEILRSICDEILISASQDKYGFTGVRYVADELPLNAPIVGIYSALKRSANPLSFVLSCDMPLLNPGFLSDLLTANHKADLIIPVHDDACYEPLCALYSRNILKKMEDSIKSEDYSLLRLAWSTNSLVFHADNSPNYRPGMFINVNTAEDFDLLVNS